MSYTVENADITNVRVIQNAKVSNIYANAKWKKNRLVEERYNKRWNADRLKRMTNNLNYTNQNIANPYIDPNTNVIDLRLIHENNVYDYNKAFTLQAKVDKRFNYYSPVDNAPPRRLPLYGSFNAINLQ